MATEQCTQIFNELISILESYDAALILHESASFNANQSTPLPFQTLIKRLNSDFDAVLLRAAVLGFIE